MGQLNNLPGVDRGSEEVAADGIENKDTSEMSARAAHRVNKNGRNTS
jgi:hypothetical protein